MDYEYPKNRLINVLSHVPSFIMEITILLYLNNYSEYFMTTDTAIVVLHLFSSSFYHYNSQSIHIKTYFIIDIISQMYLYLFYSFKWIALNNNSFNGYHFIYHTCIASITFVSIGQIITSDKKSFHIAERTRLIVSVITILFGTTNMLNAIRRYNRSNKKKEQIQKRYVCLPIFFPLIGFGLYFVDSHKKQFGSFYFHCFVYSVFIIDKLFYLKVVSPKFTIYKFKSLFHMLLASLVGFISIGLIIKPLQHKFEGKC